MKKLLLIISAFSMFCGSGRASIVIPPQPVTNIFVYDASSANVSIAAFAEREKLFRFFYRLEFVGFTKANFRATCAEFSIKPKQMCELCFWAIKWSNFTTFQAIRFKTVPANQYQAIEIFDTYFAANCILQSAGFFGS